MQEGKHKAMDDTWKTDELKKHLKSDSSNEKRHKERRHHKEDDRDEHADRKHKSDHKEKRDRRDESDRHADRRERRSYPDGDRGERHSNPDRERRERDKHPESDRHGDRERDRVRERREKDKPQVSERHRTGERERVKEKSHRGENAAQDLGTSETNKEAMRDTLEKSKRGNDDRERRHQEKREKERRKLENEQHEDRDIRHRKHREDLNNENAEKERKRSDRKHSGEPDGGRRHHSRGDKELRGNTEVMSAEDHAQNVDRRREKHSKERHSQREDRERRHREKREHKPHAEKTADKEENQVHQRRPRESTLKQESDNEKDIEETIQNTDTAYDDSTNYEEDFEDYDDDFEASEEERTPVEVQDERPPVQRSREVEEIQRAMLQENENISSVRTLPRAKEQDHHDQEHEPRDVNSSRKAHRGVFIDFGSAKQRQVSSQVASKQKKRSLEILRLVDLDFSSTFSLLDLPPVKEYEMYIRNFGKSNTKQAYVQCNDDAVDRDIQTEEIDFEEKWTQHPAEGSVVCGGHKNNSEENVGLKSRVDSQRLTSFLHSASQVMAVLLEENRSEYQSRSKVHSKEPCLSISESCFHLNTNLPFLQGRKVYHLQFSDAQRHLLLTVHSQSNESIPAFLSDKCLVCVWNIWQPSAPQKVLMCQSEVKCCCFSPGKASLVFAGTMDGSVLVWDLREDFSMHQTLTIEDVNWTFRSVTFSTDGVFTPVNHTHPVKSIEPVPSAEAKDPSLSPQGEEASGLSFQIASLDENGHLIFWVVVELRKVDPAGSQSDLGLIPGGKVKLIHSSSIDLIDKFFHKDVLILGIPETINVKFLPQDSSHFVIGTDIGIVSHGTRYGLIDPPVQYSSVNKKLRPSTVTAIDFSPFSVPAFLAGCSDGCIRLHIMSAEYPVMQWNDTTGGQSIIALQWSLTRPTMFFVLDAASSLYMWDLLQNDLQPIAKESLTSDQVLSMSVFGEPEKNNNLMGLALAKSSGTVEIQYIKKKWAKPQPKELGKLQLILQEIL